MRQSIKRIYHPYWLWEEVKSNMWGSVDDHDRYIAISIIFMSNTAKFSDSMMFVVRNWKYSCEHNLSNLSQNRVSWLGQAACAKELNSPEHITREAWWLISENSRNCANKAAEHAINYWEKEIYAKKEIK